MLHINGSIKSKMIHIKQKHAEILHMFLVICNMVQAQPEHAAYKPVSIKYMISSTI